MRPVTSRGFPLTTIIPLFAVGALLAGCSAGQAPSSEQSSAAEETLFPIPSPVGTTSADCPEAAARWAEAERGPDFYDGLPDDVRIIETNSGTVLHTGHASNAPRASAPASAAPDRVEQDPAWPQDSVVFVDPESGDVLRTILAPENMFCEP